MIYEDLRPIVERFCGAVPDDKIYQLIFILTNGQQIKFEGYSDPSIPRFIPEIRSVKWDTGISDAVNRPVAGSWGLITTAPIVLDNELNSHYRIGDIGTDFTIPKPINIDYNSFGQLKIRGQANVITWHSSWDFVADANPTIPTNADKSIIVSWLVEGDYIHAAWQGEYSW